MYRRVEFIQTDADGVDYKAGLIGGGNNAVLAVWMDRLRGRGTGKNNRYYFTELGWREIGRDIVSICHRDGIRIRVIRVKERSVDVMVGDELEVATRIRRKR